MGSKISAKRIVPSKRFLHKVRFSVIVHAKSSICYLHHTSAVTRGQGRSFVTLQAPY